MAVNETSIGRPGHLNETSQSTPDPVQLKYPTIDSQASLESLLSNSTATLTNHPSAVAPGTTPTPAMDESWASLDVSDLAPDDDDSQSETTDVGSLVDLSSTHDTESAVEDESQSEIGVDEERASNVLVRGMSRNNEQVGQPEMQENPSYDATEDTIILQRSVNQPGQDTIDLEYNRDRLLKSAHGSHLQETINMTVSRNSLILPEDRPVRICYCGNSSSQYIRDDLLGKIGAALVSPSSTTSSRTSLASTCFNIVPSEFGPGSKPAFADLIPSQAQMTVDELVLEDPDLGTDKSDEVRFSLKRGTVYESKSTNSYPERFTEEWRPDLLVVLVSHGDADQTFADIAKLIKLATRHCWPTIVVAEDASVEPYPLHKHTGISVTKQVQGQQNSARVQFPIDLDSFMAIDTDQLSHHIEYIMDHNYSQERERAAKAKQQSTISGIMSRHSFSLLDKATKSYTLTALESEPKSVPRTPVVESWVGEARRQWMSLGCRRYVKDLFFTLIVMMLGVYIVGFTQDSYSTRMTIGAGFEDATNAVSCHPTASTSTVTATLADASTPTTTLPSTDRDIAMYDPVTFDQMWHRLTGRTSSEQEQEKPPEEVTNDQASDDVVVDDERSEIESCMACHLADWLRPRLETVRHRLTRKAFHKTARLSTKQKRQAQIQEMHRKLQDFYQDVSKHMPKMSQSSQKYLKDLVTQSSHHIRQARGAGEKSLEGLISEQKRVLSRAQRRAQQLVPAHKKRPFFRRG